LILVTGACGFIGSNFVLQWLKNEVDEVVNLDLLTYAGHLGNLQDIHDDPRYQLARGDIADAQLVADLLSRHQPRALVHFAAESHVDRSIAQPGVFIHTNVIGTSTLLQGALRYWERLPAQQAQAFRFINVSTDEVFGSLEPHEPPFTEAHPYRPNSPYSASKAGADHLARAYFHTYGLPVITTNCSNNYGPRQFPEKLIPLTILNALAGKPLPIYGDGLQVRDWLHVDDHCAALRAVLQRGRPGETYNIGGRAELTNLQVVHAICEALDRRQPRTEGPYASLIRHVDDRRGHDRRYAIDDSKIATEIGWQPARQFDEGIGQTLTWYQDNQAWVESVTSGAYRQWVEQQYPALRR